MLKSYYEMIAVLSGNCCCYVAIQIISKLPQQEILFHAWANIIYLRSAD